MKIDCNSIWLKINLAVAKKQVKCERFIKLLNYKFFQPTTSPKWGMLFDITCDKLPGVKCNTEAGKKRMMEDVQNGLYDMRKTENVDVAES